MINYGKKKKSAFTHRQTWHPRKATERRKWTAPIRASGGGGGVIGTTRARPWVSATFKSPHAHRAESVHRNVRVDGEGVIVGGINPILETPFLELLTVVFKNREKKEYSCFEGEKIILNFVCKCFNGAYVIRVNYQEPVYIKS